METRPCHDDHTTFRFTFSNDGAGNLIVKEAVGRNWQEALKVLGYGPKAMWHLLHSYEEVSAEIIGRLAADPNIDPAFKAGLPPARPKIATDPIITGPVRLSSLFTDPRVRAAFRRAERDAGAAFAVPAPSASPRAGGASPTGPVGGRETQSRSRRSARESNMQLYSP